MQVIKKALEIGKSEIFYELSVDEIDTIRPGVKLLIPKRRKQLEKLQAKYEGQSDLFFKIKALLAEIQFFENF